MQYRCESCQWVGDKLEYGVCPNCGGEQDDCVFEIPYCFNCGDEILDVGERMRAGEEHIVSCTSCKKKGLDQ